MFSRFQINGVRRRLFVFNSLYQFSTTAPPLLQPPKNPFLVDYLINSLGLSKDEALSATKKVILYKSTRNHPDLVVNFLKNLGLNKTQIRSIASVNPRLLTCNVEKTIRPKILAIQELGISNSDLITVLMGYKFLLAKGLLNRPIEYLRNLLGSNENVVEVIKKFSCLLNSSAPKLIEMNVQLLLNYGLSKEHVSRFMLLNPRCFMQKPERLQKVLHTVENEFGISRNSVMFYYGVLAASTVSNETINMKVGVLRSFGFSDLTIYGMIKKFPCIVRTSEDKMKKAWNFFINETGHSPDFLGSHPVLFNLSLEKRVIPRYEVLKILKEKNLSKRKPGLYRLLTISESKFIDDFLLPYENEIPDVVDSYLKIAGRKRTRKL